MKEQYHKIWIVDHKKGTFVEIFSPLDKVQDLTERIAEVTEEGLGQGDYDIEVTMQGGQRVHGDDVYIDIVAGNYPVNNN